MLRAAFDPRAAFDRAEAVVIRERLRWAEASRSAGGADIVDALEGEDAAIASRSGGSLSGEHVELTSEKRCRRAEA
jgi:hypothetical protein